MLKLKNVDGKVQVSAIDIMPLKELTEGKLTLNPDREYIDKFDIIQRVLLCTMKLGVKFSQNEPFIDNLLLKVDSPDFFDASNINITAKKESDCLDKFYSLLFRTQSEAREEYLQKLIPTRLLETYFPKNFH